MSAIVLSRRELLRRAGVVGVGVMAMLAGCQPKVVEVTKIVEKEVEKEVTVEVEKEKVVEKALKALVKASAFWTHATHKEFLEEPFVMAPLPQAYRALEQG